MIVLTRYCCFFAASAALAWVSPIDLKSSMSSTVSAEGAALGGGIAGEFLVREEVAERVEC